MNINLKGIPTGEWRPLTPHEMTEIMDAIANSSSTAEPSGKNQEPRTKTKDTKPKNPGSGAARPAQRSSAAKQMDRATNPNPKSKALRGQGSAAPADKRYSGAKSGRGGSAGKSNASSKGFSNKR